MTSPAAPGERFRRVEELFHAALALPAHRRAAFLDEACGTDAALRAEVEALLHADASDPTFVAVVGGEARLLAESAAEAPQLLPGSRLGRYEIVAPLGAGGMGEVWRARDARLGREVAIKVLPRRLTADAVALQRFEREARAVAALSHPNILAIHDFERDGETHYAVTELLAGESLRERIRRGPAKPRQVREWGTQLARALAAAHDRGIVHRDVKPENVFLTKDGIVKLLDFGLARPQAGPQAETAVAGESSLTTAGMLVGTVGYMAPEQLRGEALDGRADVFALGCVLYELLTGERAFAAGSMAATINAIIEHDPPRLETLAETASLELARIVRRCLEKRREQRFQNAHDLAFALDPATASSPPALLASVAPPTTVRQARRWPLVAGGIALAAALSFVSAWLGVRLVGTGGSPTPLQAALILDAGRTRVDFTSLALAADATAIAFTAVERGQPRLWVHSLVTGEVRSLAGTEGASYPFWSPDSRHLGFFAAGKLKRVAAAGGAALTLAAAPDGRGGAWSVLDEIVFAPSSVGGLQRVAASGGTPRALTQAPPGKVSHRLPHFLPGGEHLLYVVAGDPGGRDGLFHLSLRSGKSRRLRPTAAEAYYARGYLLFERDGSLVAQPFDAERGELSGAPVVVAAEVDHDARTYQLLATVAERALVYVPNAAAENVLTWLDAEGNEVAKLGEPARWAAIEVSPDGRQAAVRRNTGPRSELWLVDLEDGTFRRLADGISNTQLGWAPQGDQLLIAREPAPGRHHLVAFSVRDGSERVLDRSPTDLVPTGGWSADGDTVVYARGGDLWAVAADGRSPARPLAVTAAIETYPRLSPDGRWLAYVSNETGRQEAYVASFPTMAGKRQLSLNGAFACDWAEGGRALIVADAATVSLQRVAVGERDGETHFGPPLPTYKYARPADILGWDVDPSGRRALAGVVIDKGPLPVRLVVDWPSLLERER